MDFTCGEVNNFIIRGGGYEMLLPRVEASGGLLIFMTIIGKTYYYKLEEIEDNQTHNFYGPVSSDGKIVIDKEDCDDDDTTISCFISALTGE